MLASASEDQGLGQDTNAAGSSLLRSVWGLS